MGPLLCSPVRSGPWQLCRGRGATEDVVKSRDTEFSLLAKLVLASVDRNEKIDSEAIAIYKDLIDHPTLSVPKTAAQLGLGRSLPDDAAG